MCLIVFAWQPHSAQPLVVAANRDEFYQRPTLALQRWGDEVIGGQDLSAGGTWFGINQAGRFAGLTNIRDPQNTQGSRSRGELVSGFLQGSQSAHAYLNNLKKNLGAYAGFNLLVRDAHEMYFLNSAEREIRTLEAGVYGLSNASLDSPWPKLVKARQTLSQTLSNPTHEALLALLADSERPEDAALPDTGVGIELERLLSSAFIQSDYYGTRASTALVITRDGDYHITERSFGPHAQYLGEVSLSGRFSPAP